MRWLKTPSGVDSADRMSLHLPQPEKQEEPGISAVISDPAPPSVSLSISIDPSTCSVNSENLPTLSLTVTLHASRPIMLCTYGTILNPKLALRQRNFSVFDLTANQRVWTEIGQIHRCALRRRLGDSDEKYYLTLLPETPVTITHPFSLVSRWRNRDPDKALTRSPRASDYKGEVFRNYLEPGHKYRIGVEGQGLGWWRYGTKEEVLAPAGAPPSENSCSWTEPGIAFLNVPDIEIQVED
jgi:hypothetical protein